MKKISKLSTKITVPIVCSVIISIVIVVGISLFLCTKGLSYLSSEYIHMITDKYAIQIENKMDSTLIVAETLSTNVRTTMKKGNVQRDEILNMVNSILSNHSELVGIGVGFEPNAFDNKDIENIGKKHSDKNGRFVPYTFKEGNQIDYTILEGYDDNGPDGSWYSVPKSTNKTYVTSPYWYNVGSEKYLIITCVAPILDDNGQFIGMVGFDTLIDSLNNIIESARIFDSGYLSLIAPDGTIAYHPDHSIAGNSIYDAFSKEITDGFDEAYENGKTIDVKTLSYFTGKKSLEIFAPIEVGLSGGKWIVLLSVPLSEINKIINNSVIMAILSGIAVIIAIIVILRIIINKLILKPIIKIKLSTEQLSQGNLNINMVCGSNDELGELSNNINLTSQKLSSYVNNISETLDEISNGNLALQIDMDYMGNFMPIKTAMIQIIKYLNETMTKINISSEQVATSSEQMSIGAQVLSNGAMEQTSSISQLASAIEEISSQVKSNAENAENASNKVKNVGNEILESNCKMQNMINAMTEISNSSKDIGRIIKTIEDIAFQTNILALNAAVEAARAGTAGKGFAVVADEVRSLASKSSEASKNTTALIQNSIKTVENGTQIVNEAAESLSFAVEGVEEVTTKVTKISVASKEQSDFILRIMKEVDQISSVVQTNSATAEESAASSQELSSQAQILKALVKQFQIKVSDNSLF